VSSHADNRDTMASTLQPSSGVPPTTGVAVAAFAATAPLLSRNDNLPSGPTFLTPPDAPEPLTVVVVAFVGAVVALDVVGLVDFPPEHADATIVAASTNEPTRFTRRAISRPPSARANASTSTLRRPVPTSWFPVAETSSGFSL
jgi:hypothetical protein